MFCICLLSTILNAWAIKLSYVYIIHTFFFIGIDSSFQFPMIISFAAFIRFSYRAKGKGISKVKNQGDWKANLCFVSVSIDVKGRGNGFETRVKSLGSIRLHLTRMRRACKDRRCAGSGQTQGGGAKGLEGLGEVPWPAVSAAGLWNYAPYTAYRIAMRITMWKPFADRQGLGNERQR